jgi:hypothetical protein
LSTINGKLSSIIDNFEGMILEVAFMLDEVYIGTRHKLGCPMHYLWTHLRVPQTRRWLTYLSQVKIIDFKEVDQWH